ncbi:MAG: tRNA threonylcarbamoyladenosine dehydratase [Candidatus Protistobacter heckmanni]|nr:tRNA threonylcarbamoyladenosine dehydratase [Candidatus Protistobacter heckmanni]
MSHSASLPDSEAGGPSGSADATAATQAGGFDERRFTGVARLYGEQGLARLRAARVCVIGLGGVGSWAAEALARNAVGGMVLIDMDHIAPSNANRQIHALGETFGMAKAEAMARRIADINPECRVETIEDFVTIDNVKDIMPRGCDVVVDAIDQANAKAALTSWCKRSGVPLITCGSAGGKLDPTRVRISDLNRTEQEPLLAKVRDILRRHYGFPRGPKPRYDIAAVYSDEPLLRPEEATEGGIQGINCAGYGSSVSVTASFGFAAAAWAIRRIVEQAEPREACELPEARP